MVKAKSLRIDGISPKDRAKIRSAVRQVWSRSYPRKLCIARCTDADGFQFCEECASRVPKIQVDHITPVGDILDGGIERMFCPSKKLRGLCKKCHGIKTKKDNADMRRKKDGKA